MDLKCALSIEQKLHLLLCSSHHHPVRSAALAKTSRLQEDNHQRHATLGCPPLNGFLTIQMPSHLPRSTGLRLSASLSCKRSRNSEALCVWKSEDQVACWTCPTSICLLHKT